MSALQPLRRLFDLMIDRPFVLVRPGWNWGDVLIYAGAEQLAAEIGVRFRTLDFDAFLTEPATDEVIYLHGGGGFIGTASGKAPRCLQKAITTPGATVIQGPCTLADAASLDAIDWSRTRAARVHFFTRDYTSWHLAAALPATVTHELNEDTAFYLTRSSLLRLAGITMPDEIPHPRVHLIGVREDPEAVHVSRPARLHECVLDPARYAQSFEHWIRIHLSARSILTNRTHSAIAGAILGVPTQLFAGAYHKNRSVWECSLQRRGVRWLDDASDIPRRPVVDPWLRWVPVPAVQQSWRVDRYVKRLRGIPLS